MINNLGIWNKYTPSPWPDGIPAQIMFAQRAADGVDWYAFNHDAASFTANSAKLLLRRTSSNDPWQVVQANRDATILFPQDGALLLEIADDIGSSDVQHYFTKVYVDGADALSDPAPTASDLIAYANQRQWAKVTAGYPYTAADGQTYTIPTTESSMSLISGKFARLSQPNAPTSVWWQVGPTSFIDIQADDFKTLATNIADFVQATFDTLRSNVVPAILAGTITTTAQIDAAFT